MWTRRDLKDRAKAAFNDNYWRSVLAGFVASLAIGGSAFGSFSMNFSDSDVSQAGPNFAAVDTEWILFFLITLLGILAVSLAVAVVISVFLRNPLIVGVNRFFLVNSENAAYPREMGYGFGSGRYLKTVGTMVLMDLYVFLFSLLFLIPGIIKAYDYLLVPYILADDPTVSGRQALRLSKDMMRGNRWNAFVLQLSFLPWDLLNVLTLGILGIFYVMPYQMQTNAELYRTLKANYEAQPALV